MPPNVKQLKILLAEDDEDDRYFFDKALKKLPISSHLSIMPDGEELMNYLSGNSENLPDVLFLDINMPRKNGFECLLEIKHSKLLKDIPVVMFSTTNAWDTIGMLFKSGANVYIHKPGDFAQLKEVIFHALPIASEKSFSTSQVKYILNAL
jgi:CheY-like chemotaxis protein